MVKRGSAPLRALRDFLIGKKEEGVKSVNPRDLPKDRQWNSILQTLRTKAKDGSEVETKSIDWNPLRGKDGNVSVESVEKYLDSMAPTGLNVGQTHWYGAQRHSNLASQVITFNITDDHVKKLKDAGLWDDFQQMSEKLPELHPQTPLSLGWVRFTNHKEDVHNQKVGNVFVDEFQSDLLKPLRKLPPEKQKKMSDILFNGGHPSDLLHEAFQEYGRQQGWTGIKYRMHSVDSKKKISLEDHNGEVPVHFKVTYEEMPKKMHADPAKYGEKDFSESETHSQIRGDRAWEIKLRKMEEEFDGYSDWE
jgi:hypothetical protein